MLGRSMLRTPQAASYLGVSAATLAKWRVFGGGPRYRKLGRVVVYDPAELEQWVEARSRTSTSPDAAGPRTKGAAASKRERRRDV